MNRDAVLAHAFPPIEAHYGTKELILYALGTGFGAEPRDPAHLDYLYEKNLSAVPTFANVLGSPGPWMGDPRFGIALRKIVHAEQRLTLHAPLPVACHVVSRNDVMGIRDRGAEAGAFLYQRKRVEDAASGTPIASIVSTLLLRGDGGCGDHGEAPEALGALPGEAPSFRSRSGPTTPPLWSTGSAAISTRSMSIRRSLARSASSGRSCTASRPWASPATRC